MHDAQLEAESLRMPLRFLARLRQLLAAPAPPPAAPTPAAEAAPLNGATEPLSVALNGAAAEQQEDRCLMAQSRRASGAAASTSAAAAQQPPATALSGCKQQAARVEAVQPSNPTSSDADVLPEDAALAAAVQEIQTRRCPPLGRFGHGTAYNVRVTKRARQLPFSVKARVRTVLLLALCTCIPAHQPSAAVYPPVSCCTQTAYVSLHGGDKLKFDLPEAKTRRHQMQLQLGRSCQG